MQNRPLITLEEMRMEAELFRSVYPELIREIRRVENTRGKLGDFQLMMAVSQAKNGLGVVSFERRQTINAIFETFRNIYGKHGRTAAEEWAQETFECGIEKTKTSKELTDEDLTDIRFRIEELTHLIQVKESELLQFYRELYSLQKYLSEDEAL